MTAGNPKPARRVLVLDDEPNIRESLAEYLEDWSTDFQLDDGLRAIGVTEHDVFFKPVADMRIFDSAKIRKKMAEAGS
jgi:CheY-like chemotaxis protein